MTTGQDAIPADGGIAFICLCVFVENALAWPARSNLKNGPDAVSGRSASRECLLLPGSNQSGRLG